MCGRGKGRGLVQGVLAAGAEKCLPKWGQFVWNRAEAYRIDHEGAQGEGLGADG